MLQPHAKISTMLNLERRSASNIGFLYWLITQTSENYCICTTECSSKRTDSWIHCHRRCAANVRECVEVHRFHCVKPFVIARLSLVGCGTIESRLFLCCVEKYVFMVLINVISWLDCSASICNNYHPWPNNAFATQFTQLTHPKPLHTIPLRLQVDEVRQSEWVRFGLLGANKKQYAFLCTWALHRGTDSNGYTLQAHTPNMPYIFTHWAPFNFKFYQ